MLESVIKQFREKIRRKEYVMTLHARREMLNDRLSIHDVEQAVLLGRILERQKDRITGERKYRVRGEALDGSMIELILKLSPTGKLVIITVYDI